MNDMRNGTSLLLEQTTFTKVYVCVLYNLNNCTFLVMAPKEKI